MSTNILKIFWENLKRSSALPDMEWKVYRPKIIICITCGKGTNYCNCGSYTRKILKVVYHVCG